MNASRSCQLDGTSYTSAALLGCFCGALEWVLVSMHVLFLDKSGVIGVLPACRIEDGGIVPQLRAVVQVVEEDVDKDVLWDPVLADLCDLVCPPAHMRHK